MTPNKNKNSLVRKLPLLSLQTSLSTHKVTYTSEVKPSKMDLVAAGERSMPFDEDEAGFGLLVVSTYGVECRDL